jgi:predicted glycoside hydrolase/deacetylase ChbG (UPF0249 family)
MSKKLIVNADDYGRAPGVSRGILQAHQEGIVTSTTVMINQPGIESQLAEALACPDLGIGLHLVFTSRRPVLPSETISGIVDQDGAFFDQHTLWARAEEASLKHLQAELAAQIARFAALVGRLPDHLDCHHFVYLYPPFFQVYADLAVQFQLPVRVPFPIETDFAQAIGALPYLEGFPSDLVKGMIVSNSALLKSRRLIHPDHFVSTFFGRKALTLDFLLHLLDSLPDDVSELMCHPGFDDPNLDSDYGTERETELALLTNPVVRERLEQLDIELVTFGDLRSNLDPG